MSNCSVSKFKVGDRVRIYERSLDIVGKVEGICQTGELCVLPDGGLAPHDLRTAHPKQCRRLKKRERRRVWFTVNKQTKEVLRPYWTEPSRLEINTEDWDIVEFVQVRKSK